MNGWKVCPQKTFKCSTGRLYSFRFIPNLHVLWSMLPWCVFYMKYESESFVVPYRHAIIILLCGTGSELVWWNEILIKVISLRVPYRQASRVNVAPRIHLHQTASDMWSNGKKAMGHEYKTGALGMCTCGCPAEFLSKRVNQCDCLWTCLF